MKRSVWLWQLIGFAVTSLGGTLLHFAYDLTDKAALVSPFSAVNESTWEHMKLLFWPMLVFAIIQSFFFKENNDFWRIKLYGTLIGLTLIPTLFYTYNGVIGKSSGWVNISIFFIAALISYVYEYRELNKKSGGANSPRAAFITLLFIALLFVIFTFNTPHLAIFEDPINKSYGI